MDLHFEFNKKTEKGYCSKITNEKGNIVAIKITKKRINVNDFVLVLINNEEIDLDLREELKKTRRLYKYRKWGLINND